MKRSKRSGKIDAVVSKEPGGESAVQKFYHGGHVFVTGATGFMGKVLVEKLLRSCPAIDTVYLLLRNKRGKTAQQRVEDLASSPCFDRLRQEHGPGFKSKLHPVQGDIEEAALGLSEQDRHLLAQRVTVVFHVAATVRFDEQISVAVKRNVRATRDVLALCRTCARLKAVVHVSTVYANCVFPDVVEKFYEMPLDCDQVIEMVETLSEDLMTSKTKELLGDWPNSYTFTKALAEQVVRKHGRGLPVAVYRPAIVVCSDREPVSGWTDNYIGLAGFILAGAAGIFRTSCYDLSASANIVPCDLSVNSIVVAAWEVAEERSISSDIPIYNFVPARKITWNQWSVQYQREVRESPISQMLWYPFHLSTPGGAVGHVFRFLLHILPAILFDTVFKVQGKTPTMYKTLEKIHKFADITMELGKAPIHFDLNNVPEMWKLTSDEDKALFPFDMKSFDWESYIHRTYLGMRKYMAKEDVDTIPAARIKLQRLFWIHWLTVGVVLSLLGWIVFSILFNFTRYIIAFTSV